MKIKKILETAIEQNDTKTLKNQILKTGLKFKEIRKVAWPLLCLGTSNFVKSQLSDSEKQVREHQLKVDVDRSFCHTGLSDLRRLELRRQLLRLLTAFFDRHLHMHYYQGIFC
jgi:Rab-GTPase-TBC domain